MVDNFKNRLNNALKLSNKKFIKLHKKIVEGFMLDQVCTIKTIVEESIKDEYGVERFNQREVTYENIPCHLDYVKYGRVTTSVQDLGFSSTKYATLFLPLDINVPLNSVVEITVGDEVVVFENTGMIDRYDTHLEIPIQRKVKG
ncbi:hypothetical protein [Streptobacillus moniliformis]|uniref:hypothetical protein n=1 Tax=Streptobacillus moniliformis TaxID=34105 RepID=UPI0007E37B44|nr:hypothetical protein [Streptobacillus moniliformis]